MVRSGIDEIQASTKTDQRVETQAQAIVKQTKIMRGEEIPAISPVIPKNAALDEISAARLAAGTRLLNYEKKVKLVGRKLRHNFIKLDSTKARSEALAQPDSSCIQTTRRLIMHLRWTLAAKAIIRASLVITLLLSNYQGVRLTQTKTADKWMTTCLIHPHGLTTQISESIKANGVEMRVYMHRCGCRTHPY